MRAELRLYVRGRSPDRMLQLELILLLCMMYQCKVRRECGDKNNNTDDDDDDDDDDDMVI